MNHLQSPLCRGAPCPGRGRRYGGLPCTKPPLRLCPLRGKPASVPVSSAPSAGEEIRFVTRSLPRRDPNFSSSEPMQIPPPQRQRCCWETWIPASLALLPPSILHPRAMLSPWVPFSISRLMAPTQGCSASPCAPPPQLPHQRLGFKCPFSGRQKNHKSPECSSFPSCHRWGSQLVAWGRKGFSLFLEQ